MQDVLIHSQRSRIVLLCNDAAMAATISEGGAPLSINNASSYGNSTQNIIGLPTITPGYLTTYHFQRIS